MQYGGAASYDLWMPFNFGQFMRKIELLTPDRTADYVRSIADDWIQKRLRSRAKASWAAKVRWARARGIDPSTLEHPSIAESIVLPPLKTIELWIGKAKKRSEKASKAAKARWAKVRAARSMESAAAPPLLHISPVLTTAYSATTPIPPAGFFGRIVGALSGNLTRGAAAGPAEDVPQRTRRSRGRDTGQAALPVACDARYDQFRDEVMRFWRDHNPRHECPWERRDRRVLEKLLASNQLTVEVFHTLLVNRGQSDINPSQLPRKWLGGIMEYAAGPLDRFGKLKRATTSMRQPGHQPEHDSEYAEMAKLVDAYNQAYVEGDKELIAALRAQIDARKGSRDGH